MSNAKVTSNFINQIRMRKEVGQEIKDLEKERLKEERARIKKEKKLGIKPVTKPGDRITEVITSGIGKDGKIVEKTNKGLVNTIFMDEAVVKKAFDFDSLIKEENLNVLVINQYELAAHLKMYSNEKGMNVNITYVQYENEKYVTKDEENPAKWVGYKYIHVKNDKELDALKMKKEFDVILANPPYNGKAKLHQKFFIAAYEMLKENGVMAIIQPSSPYITAFNDSTKSKEDMVIRDIVVNNYSEVKLLSPTTFKNAELFYPLSVTTLTKKSSPLKGVDVFVDIENTATKNVDINYINTTETNPETHKVMSNKVEQYIKKGLCAKDKVYFAGKTVLSETEKPLKITVIRGNRGGDDGTGYKRHKDFYTWIPENGKDGLPKFKDPNKPATFGLVIDKDVDPKVAYSYLRTYFARYCMSLGKYNHHLDSSCLVTTPLVSFDREWTDEELFAEVGFTDEEIAEVYRIIPSYYS